ncbi:hypothetical protein ANN_24699 [Periplaneta americana]|uniref:Uncharacterized protein n=1 Tax=Periplaneta americana TaxID=6978 RepID=A0ABQ8RZK9_PERAM|nr:hypothetical protein ANN_24699 [Periplaneta americana]
MSPGSSTESYPAFARIGLRENPGKNLNQFLNTDHDFELRILWTNEITFKSNGQVNQYNAHYWTWLIHTGYVKWITSATCYMNSVLQQLYMVESIRVGILASEGAATDLNEDFRKWERMEGDMEEQLEEEQFGFRKGKCTGMQLDYYEQLAKDT